MGSARGLPGLALSLCAERARLVIGCIGPQATGSALCSCSQVALHPPKLPPKRIESNAQIVETDDSLRRRWPQMSFK